MYRDDEVGRGGRGGGGRGGRASYRGAGRGPGRRPGAGTRHGRARRQWRGAYAAYPWVPYPMVVYDNDEDILLLPEDELAEILSGLVRRPQQQVHRLPQPTIVWPPLRTIFPLPNGRVPHYRTVVGSTLQDRLERGKDGNASILHQPHRDILGSIVEDLNTPRISARDLFERVLLEKGK